jgi:hypothetical protein
MLWGRRQHGGFPHAKRCGNQRQKKRFLIDDRVRATAVVDELDGIKVTYPILLSILRNNGLAAAPVEGVVNIVPVPMSGNTLCPLFTRPKARFLTTSG